MAKKLVWLLLLVLAVPVLAADSSAPSRVTVERLEHILSGANSKTDGDLARQISSLTLTERLSDARYQQLKALLPGEKSRVALLALADSSAFLEPPVSDIPATAAPNIDAQKRMLALTLGYLGKTLPLLPDLFATRDTQRFESRAAAADTADENPLRPMDRSALTVFYRENQEFVDTSSSPHGKKQSPDRGLTTWGEFGPILGIVVMDAARSRLAWSHWELTPGGALAVFHYSVPKEKSHYDVRFCCVIQQHGFELSVLSQRAGYHGEIAVDPDNGTILRISLIADLEPGNPIEHAATLVEYGPQDIGGKTFICPLRGIALAQGPDLKSLSDAMAQRHQTGIENLQPSIEKASLQALVRAPEQTLLNDVIFRDYHLYLAHSRILSEKEAKDATEAVASAPAPASVPNPDNARPLEEVASPKAPPPQQGLEALASNAPPPSLAGSQPSSIPEIYVTPALSLPQTPTISLAGAPAGTPTFRINARIVDVPLVALDKKGHPLTDLNPDDLEIFDNGVKVDVRSFVKPNTGAPDQAAPQFAGQSQPDFSNREAVAAKAAARQTQDTLILLIDNTLSMGDLSNVRQQMEEFLQKLQYDDRAAVYVMRRGGFQILQAPTTDHQLIASTLAKWTPSADNLMLGQEQEARNRQQMEFVHNTEDLLAVNGNTVLDAQPEQQSQDPKLRELGDRPGSDALTTLMVVAHHLSAIQGHKNLVWIASDNVLADWNYSSMNIQKGDRNIEPAALRVQEAMNDAHISVYPLDASRLEGGMISASEASMNVQLNPVATANQLGVSPGAGGTSGCGLASGPGGRDGSHDPALSSGADIDTCNNDMRPGRMFAQAHADMLSIQGVYREIADATGGQAFRRASDIVGELNHVADDGRATYLLSFAPSAAADNKYHVITVKAPGKKKVTLRYRTGYFYREEPSTLKDRFRDAALAAGEATDIGVTASVAPGSNGHSIKLGIAASDLEIAQNDSLWTDKVDVFLVERQLSGMKAQITGQTMNLRLQPGSYQKYLKEGIPFDQAVELPAGIGSVRIVVLDENSGRMGSVTIPAAALGKSS